MPGHDLAVGDIGYCRFEVLEHYGDAIKVRIADYPRIVITTYLPVNECAKAEDIGRLLPRIEVA